jgi:hypothetical protein
MQCRDVRIKLSAYLDNELVNEDRDKIAEHLGSCSVCQAIYKDFSLTRYYLRRLKQSPDRVFVSDAERIFKSTPPAVAPKLTLKPVMVAAALALVIISMLVLLIPDMSTKLTRQRPDSVDSKRALFKRPGIDANFAVTRLAAGKEFVFDNPAPKLIAVEKDSWISVAGKGYLQRTEHALKIDLTDGSLGLVLGKSFKTKTTINAAGFQVSPSGTEFIAQLEDDKLSVQLLKGKLLLSYKDQSGLKLSHLLPGYGVSGTINDDIRALKTYQLSSSQLVNLKMELDRIKQIGKWAGNNSNDEISQSTDVRIEFWKEEQ